MIDLITLAVKIKSVKIKSENCAEKSFRRHEHTPSIIFQNVSKKNYLKNTSNTGVFKKFDGRVYVSDKFVKISKKHIFTSSIPHTKEFFLETEKLGKIKKRVESNSF